MDSKRIKKKLSNTKILRAQNSSRQLFDKDECLLVFDYEPTSRFLEVVDLFLTEKSLEISDNTSFNILGWNNNKIYFIKK